HPWCGAQRRDRAGPRGRRSRLSAAVRAPLRGRQAAPGLVSPLYLYAVLGAVPATPIGEGMMGEALHLVDCGEVIAAAGEIARAPSLAPDALRSHDAVVRRLADVADAVLPARFGAIASDETDLCERLARASDTLREALAQVAGREQMILRVFSDTSDAPSPPAGTVPSAESDGPGTRYLAERARAQRAA